MRPHLLAWQWSDYAVKHRDRANLLLHLVAVPLFQVSAVVLLGAVAAGGAVRPAMFAVAGMVVSVVLQGRGHRREDAAPTPFDDTADFVTRFLAEQWVNFPRFVLSGGWYRSFRAAHSV